ncbi:hypothetical protein EV368DRAFT_84466 [Lentinula lateritia]|nr:hypothetical protein EV368DRAFT_84466 [Lentinula lateritia]
MIASSELLQEPWYKATTNGSDISSFDGLSASAGSITRPTPKPNRKASLYSLIAGKDNSLFSNSSQQTVTPYTSLQSSTTSFSTLSSNISPLEKFRLKKAKSSFNMQGPASPSAIAGPSDLSRIHSVTAISQSNLRKDLWAPANDDDDAVLRIIDRPPNLSRISTETDTPKVSVRVVGRGGQGSRPRPTNQRISHLHQSLQDQQISPTSLVDSFDNVSRTHAKAPAVPGPVSIARVVGRGGLGSKRRVHLNSSSTFLSPSLSSGLRVYPHQRTQSTPTHSRTFAGSSSSLQSPAIRVSSRGGAGSRLRVKSPSPASGPSLATMCKIKWKNRKRAQSKSDTTAFPEPSISPRPKISRFVSLKRAKVDNDIPQSNDNNDDESQHPPVIPVSPPLPNTVDLEHDPTSTFTTLSVYVHPSDVRLPAAAPRNKLERTLGDAVPSHMLPSANANHIPDIPLGKQDRRRSRGSIHSLSSLSSTAKSNQRRSVARSLSSLGSFIRFSNSRPSSDVFVYSEEGGNDVFDVVEGDDDKEEVCWIDNEFESYPREGTVTPISPMVFSVRPPSPMPPFKPELIVNSDVSVDGTSASVVSVVTEADGQDSSVLSSDDRRSAHSEVHTQATSPNDSSLSDTPFSFTDVCDTAPRPASPIIFFSEPEPESERPSSTVHPLTLRSDAKSNATESTPRTELEALLSEPIQSLTNSPSATSLFRSSFPFHLRREEREVVEPHAHGWTGEWNRKNMQDVIRSLRELK